MQRTHFTPHYTLYNCVCDRGKKGFSHTYVAINRRSTSEISKGNSGLLIVPRIAMSTKRGITFSYLAPKLWNSLPDNDRGSDTV